MVSNFNKTVNSQIMDKLLDKEVHPQYKAPSLVMYLTPRHTACHTPPTSGATAAPSGSQDGPINPRDPGPHGHRHGATGTSGHRGQGHASRASELDDFAVPDDHRQRGGASGGANGARPKTYTSITYGQR